MKFTVFSIASIALLQIASAQPHKARHAHADAHRKRQQEVEVLVYVDAEGIPVSTTMETITISASSTSSSSSVPEYTPPPPPPPPPPPANPAPAPAPAPAPPANPAPPPPPPSSGTNGIASEGAYGISYSPYNADSTCKTQAQVNTDFAAFGPSHAGGVVRLYGTDCNQMVTVLSAAKQYDMKIFAGIFNINNIASEVALIAAAVNGDWTPIDTVSVGNELVNSGQASAATVVAAIGTAKSLLKNAGYNGAVVTVDTLIAMRNFPTLCHASSYCAVNCHPFFDGSTPASGAGDFLNTMIKTLASAVNDNSKKIVITETGWPTQGQSNGVAVPSPANQNTALSSIKSAFAGNEGGVVLFTPFNNLWKTNSPGEYETEQFWGWMGNSPSG